MRSCSYIGAAPFCLGAVTLKERRAGKGQAAVDGVQAAAFKPATSGGGCAVLVEDGRAGDSAVIARGVEAAPALRRFIADELQPADLGARVAMQVKAATVRPCTVVREGVALEGGIALLHITAATVPGRAVALYCQRRRSESAAAVIDIVTATIR